MNDVFVHRITSKQRKRLDLSNIEKGRKNERKKKQTICNGFEGVQIGRKMGGGPELVACNRCEGTVGKL